MAELQTSCLEPTSTNLSIAPGDSPDQSCEAARVTGRLRFRSGDPSLEPAKSYSDDTRCSGELVVGLHSADKQINLTTKNDQNMTFKNELKENPKSDKQLNPI